MTGSKTSPQPVPEPPESYGVTRRAVGPDETRSANRAWWDAEARPYYLEHGDFLGDDVLVWGPEGWTETELGLLGTLDGRDVLEVGCGAGQGARYAAAQGARVVATDLSAGMLAQSRTVDAARGTRLPLTQCDGGQLPFADASFDLVFTAYGVLPFVADSTGVLREWARVLRPGGRVVASTTHPFRWALPDAPGEEGLTVSGSYFDRTPYVEVDDSGRATYTEHHRTLGDRVRDVVAAGLVLEDLVELEWPEHNAQVWGGWSPLRGRLIPGTVVLVAQRPG